MQSEPGFRRHFLEEPRMNVADQTAESEVPAARGNPATRALIMEAGVRVLDRTNFFDVGVDEIVQEAGLARGTFYIYFRDKYDLLAALIRGLNEELFEQSHLHLEGPTTPYDRIRLSLRRVISAWEQHASIFRAMAQVSLSKPEFLELDQKLRMPFIRQIRRDIERTIAEGHAPAIDAAVAAKALAAMMDKFCLTWFAMDEPPYPNASQEIDHVTDNLAQLWYRAIYGADPPQRVQPVTAETA